MRKSRSLAISMLGLACLILIACQTGGTPKQSDRTPTKSLAAAAPHTPPPTDSASLKRTASHSRDVKSVTSAQRKDRPGKAANILGNFSKAFMGKKIDTLRAILYATLAVIFIVVIGAIAAERVGRHRKMTPSG